MKLKTKEWNWAEGAEQAKSKMKSIYWWNGWLALPALLRKRNGAQPKESKAPRQALQLTLSLSARSSAVKRENEVEGSLLSLVFFFCGGLWAGPPANAPQKRKTSENKQTQQLFSFGLLPSFFSLLLLSFFSNNSLVVGYRLASQTQRKTAIEQIKWKEKQTN